MASSRPPPSLLFLQTRLFCGSLNSASIGLHHGSLFSASQLRPHSIPVDSPAFSLQTPNVMLSVGENCYDTCLLTSEVCPWKYLLGTSPPMPCILKLTQSFHQHACQAWLSPWWIASYPLSGGQESRSLLHFPSSLVFAWWPSPVEERRLKEWVLYFFFNFSVKVEFKINFEEQRNRINVIGQFI